MAFEQIKLSKHEQWAQNLKAELAGMIPLADFWAIAFDHSNGSFAKIVQNIHSDPAAKQLTTNRQKRALLKELNSDQNKDYRNARRVCRSWYESLEAFQAAEAQMWHDFCVREYTMTCE